MGKKVFLAIAGAILLAGLVLAVVGAVLGGAHDITQAGTYSFRLFRASSYWPFHRTTTGSDFAASSAISNADIPHPTSPPVAQHSENGSGQVAEGDSLVRTGTSIYSLDIDVAVGTLKIKSGNAFRIEVEGPVPLEYHCYNDEWTILQPDFNLGLLDDHNIHYTITVPEHVPNLQVQCDVGAATISDISADQLVIQVAAGSVKLNGIQTGEAELYVEAGSIKADNMTCSTLAADCEVGSIYYEGDVSDSVSAEVSAGSIIIKMAEPAQYQYDIDVDLGSISLGNQRYNAFSQEESGGRTGTYFDLSCEMGSIQVKFQ